MLVATGGGRGTNARGHWGRGGGPMLVATGGGRGTNARGHWGRGGGGDQCSWPLGEGGGPMLVATGGGGGGGERRGGTNNAPSLHLLWVSARVHNSVAIHWCALFGNILSGCCSWLGHS